MRSSGAIEYITPLQSATESSTTPKSVMKTTVGGAGAGGLGADCPAGEQNRRKNPSRNVRQATGGIVCLRIGKRKVVYWSWKKMQNQQVRGL